MTFPEVLDLNPLVDDNSMPPTPGPNSQVGRYHRLTYVELSAPGTAVTVRHCFVAFEDSFDSIVADTSSVDSFGNDEVPQYNLTNRHVAEELIQEKVTPHTMAITLADCTCGRLTDGVL